MPKQKPCTLKETHRTLSQNDLINVIEEELSNLARLVKVINDL